MEENKYSIFYDILSKSCDLLYDATNEAFSTLTLMTLTNIASGEVKQDIKQEYIDALTDVYSNLSDIDINVADVLKAIQSLILKGYREEGVPNGAMTPDSIGLLMAYFVSRLNKSTDTINICDPLIGTGNLLFTISNHLTLQTELYGVDNNEYLCKLSSVIANLLEQKTNIYYQDTLTTHISNMDFVVFDMPKSLLEEKTESFFPYEVIKYYMEGLKESGYMIGLVQDDFFEYDKNQKFKEAIDKKLTVVGIFDLPDGIFSSGKKNIVVFKKGLLKHKKVLMAKLPSFNDPTELNKFFVKVEEWFENNL